MTDEERRAISWVTQPGSRDPANEGPCDVEMFAEYSKANGASGVEWAVEEWKEACQEWRVAFRFRNAGIDEANEEGEFGVWAVEHDGERPDTEFFEDFLDAYRKWKEYWKTPR